MPVDPIAISRSALDVEWQRLQIVAQNLANQNSARVAGSAGYRALILVSGQSGGFGRLAGSRARLLPRAVGSGLFGSRVRSRFRRFLGARFGL